MATIENAAVSIINKFETVEDRYNNVQSDISHITVDIQNIRGEMQTNMNEFGNRLKDINTLIEVNDARRARRHALEMQFLRSEKRAAINMYKHSRNINIVFGAIVVILLIVLIISNHKTNIIIAQYDMLANNYIEILEKYVTLEDVINDLQPATDASTSSADAIATPDITTMTNESQTEFPVVLNLTDITQPSNLTADQLDAIINARLTDINKPDGRINGIGEALVKMEQEYKVNALFCLSVGSFESGHGTSAAALSRNNLFGLIGSDGIMYFDSIDECISYWGNLIRKYYIDEGLTTISAIQKKYCPDSSTWAGNVEYFMDTYAAHVNSYFV